MPPDIRKYLESTGPLSVSAPCRIDLGGTLDIKTFHLPLAALSPVTFNAAISLRTTVTIGADTPGRVSIHSRGFESLAFSPDQAPFDHPLGLMFAIAAHFQADGIRIEIDSASPPRSALGGSSAAALALVAAFWEAKGEPLSALSRERLVLLAHALEESVARVPCGMQDHLAAAYGGMNAWYWQPCLADPLGFERRDLSEITAGLDFNACFLLAYGGRPHESRDINGRWVTHFLRASDRFLWQGIVADAQGFVAALARPDLDAAVTRMNAEVDKRRQMTPEVFDSLGLALADCARENGCGARFTGAGGGGCVWALGTPAKISALKPQWQDLLSTTAEACLLPVKIEDEGLRREAEVES